MSDLHRAVQDEIASFTPPVAPAFETITARKRARDRRRVVTGAAALSAVAMLAVVAVPSLTGTGGDRLTAARPPTSFAAPPDGGLTWTGATICLTGDACRTLGAEQAQQLDDALDTAVPASPDSAYCRAAGQVYTVRFEHPAARTVPITVRTPCGPREQGNERFLLAPIVPRQVEAMYQEAGSQPVDGRLISARVNGLAVGDSIAVTLATPCGVPSLLIDGVPYVATGYAAPGASPDGWGTTHQGRLRRTADDSAIFVADDSTVRLQFFAAPGRRLQGCT